MRIWRGASNLKPIATEVERVTLSGETVYRVWPAHLPEPPGNPVKWWGSTLRLIGYEPEREEAA